MVPEKYLLIIGTAKSGTTSLARWLGSRPDMVLGKTKEPRFLSDMATESWSGPGGDIFHRSILRDEESYRQNFETAKSADWAIDGSTDYLWHPSSTDRIAAFAETRTVRLICLTRDPVDRAVSEYNHTRQAGRETLSFAESLAAEAGRRAARWQPLFYHRRRSEVHDDLDRFHRRFGADLLVLDHHELHDREALNRKISAFLDIPVMDMADSEIHNRRALPRNRLAGALLAKNPALSRGRRLLPKPLRNRLRPLLVNRPGATRAVSAEEIHGFRALIAEEISACKESPLINTANWKTALVD